jgi:cobalt/nickel transport system permease protein
LTLETPLELPFTYLLLLLGGVGVLWVLSALAVSRSRRREAAFKDGQEKDWSVPILDVHGRGQSPFHCWDLRIKVLSILLFIFCLSGLSQPCTAFLSLFVGLGSIAAARLPFNTSLRRISAMGGFLGMFLLVMPLTAPIKSGDAVILFDHLHSLPFNLRGFKIAVVIALKACAIALLIEPLLATAPFSSTVQALARLGLPRTICQMLLLTHRYIYVFQHEAQRMSRGMQLRGFKKRGDLETLHILGDFLGMLLVRSFERTQRVHDAMLSRGYDGRLPETAPFRATWIDWAKGGSWVLAGLAFILLDRLWPTLRFFGG